MSRFTTTDWIKLPFVIVLRAPFAILSALFNLIAKGFENLAYHSELVMDCMPEVEYRKEWVEEQYAKQVKERLDGLRSTSQVEKV